MNSGAIWVLGGRGPDDNITSTAYWAVPNSADGTISRWSQLDATNLLEPRAGAAAAPVGQHVYVTGGASDSGLLATTLRDVPARHRPHQTLSHVRGDQSRQRERAHDQPLRVPGYELIKVVLSTHMDLTGDIDATGFTLRANEGIIFEVD